MIDYHDHSENHRTYDVEILDQVMLRILELHPNGLEPKELVKQIGCERKVVLSQKNRWTYQYGSRGYGETDDKRIILFKDRSGIEHIEEIMRTKQRLKEIDQYLNEHYVSDGYKACAEALGENPNYIMSRANYINVPGRDVRAKKQSPEPGLVPDGQLVEMQELVAIPIDPELELMGTIATFIEDSELDHASIARVINWTRDRFLEGA